MDNLRNKATSNLQSIRTIFGPNGLFALHAQIWDKKYKDASKLIFWMNGSLDLHNIVEFPVNSDRLLQIGNDRVFNFVDSLYPKNFRKEAENGLLSAFQFQKLPKVRMKRDEILDDFYLFQYR